MNLQERFGLVFKHGSPNKHLRLEVSAEVLILMVLFKVKA